MEVEVERGVTRYMYGMDVMYTMVWHAPMHTICKTTYAQITMEPKCCTQTTETAIQDFGPATSQQHEPNLTSSHLGTHPIVNVVLQMAVADPELEVFEHVTVFHDVKRVEDIKVLLLGENKQVVHQLLKRHGSGDVVVRVSRVQHIVLLMPNDRRW